MNRSNENSIISNNRSSIGPSFSYRHRTPENLCLACQQPIFDSNPVVACGATWHSKCLVCQECGRSLISENFQEDSCKPYCLDCYGKYLAPLCAACNNTILDKCAVALGKAWHPEHFCCTRCGIRITENVQLMCVNDQPYCQVCYLEDFGVLCAGCNKHINGNYTTAMNKHWHPNCFACSQCRIALLGKSYYQHLGMPLCELDYAKITDRICSACDIPITDRCINAMKKRFHEHCFKCCYCQKQLRTGIFKEKSGKQYCHQCYSRLFG